MTTSLTTMANASEGSLAGYSNTPSERSNTESRSHLAEPVKKCIKVRQTQLFTSQRRGQYCSSTFFIRYRNISSFHTAVDPDPHGSAIIFPPGSESWRDKFEIKKHRKNARKWVVIVILFWKCNKFVSKALFTFEHSFFTFSTSDNSFYGH